LGSIFFINLLIFVFINHSNGQERLNLYTGLGFPEGLTLGAQIQSKQMKTEVGFGSLLLSGQWGISGDVSYHFGGSTQLSIRLPWYIKGGLAKWFRNSVIPDSPLAANFRIGRDINLSKKAGLKFELGLLVGKEFVNNYIWGISESGIAPGFGLFFFYRL